MDVVYGGTRQILGLCVTDNIISSGGLNPGGGGELCGGLKGAYESIKLNKLTMLR